VSRALGLRERVIRGGGSIPLADSGGLRRAARRTAVIRLGLAAGLVVLLVCAVLAAQDLRARPTSYFASGGGGILVMDLSTSVDPARYRRISRVLRTLIRTDQPVGLVTFSDTSYEMLPPGTRGEELGALLRFFEPPPGGQGPGARVAQGFGFLESPWSGTFRGGTRISKGLRVARRMVERDGLVNPQVLLMSDLDDSPLDLSALTQESVAYQREGIRLRVVPLFPNQPDRQFFATLVGADAFVQNDELLANSQLEERQTLVGAFPILLVALSVLLLLGLAANEHLGARLSWRRAA
jgi:hypothetical protein